MKKLTIFFIATLLGVAIMSCSKHDETLSPNVGAQKTVQYDEDVEMERYYESYLNFLDSILTNSPDDISYVDYAAISLFNEHWNWLFNDSDIPSNITLFGEIYQIIKDELFRNYYCRPMDRSFVESIITHTELFSLEKMFLLDLAATLEHANRYQRCRLLVGIDNQKYYFVGNFAEWFDNTTLAYNIDMVIGGVEDGSVLIVYKNSLGELDFEIVSESWLEENGYQNISENRRSECLDYYNAELEAIYTDFKDYYEQQENLLNQQRNLYGACLDSNSTSNKKIEEKVLKRLERALRNYRLCVDSDLQNIQTAYFN